MWHSAAGRGVCVRVCVRVGARACCVRVRLCVRARVRCTVHAHAPAACGAPPCARERCPNGDPVLHVIAVLPHNEAGGALAVHQEQRPLRHQLHELHHLLLWCVHGQAGLGWGWLCSAAQAGQCRAQAREVPSGQPASCVCRPAAAWPSTASCALTSGLARVGAQKLARLASGGSGLVSAGAHPGLAAASAGLHGPCGEVHWL